MAKGRRGGGRPQRAQGGRGNASGARRRDKRSRRDGAVGAELPTAAPGTADAPASSAIFGGSAVTLPPAGGTARPVPRVRSRGGPRPEHERRAARRRGIVYDFRYVGSDLRWIFGTTAASAALVLVLWAVIRA